MLQHDFQISEPIFLSRLLSTSLSSPQRDEIVRREEIGLTSSLLELVHVSLVEMLKSCNGITDGHPYVIFNAQTNDTKTFVPGFRRILFRGRLVSKVM